MSTYAIGDLQGCRGCFDALLQHINFQPDQDRLLLAGDLVNRGPDSLGALRRVYQLRDRVDVVLGNHDLHLLAVAHGASRLKKKDTLSDILDAPDRHQLLDWLQHQPLMVEVPAFDAVLVHAGLAPLWTLQQARERAREVEAVLADPARAAVFFDHMYGNQPAGWRENLQGPERWRVITNHFTRMRFVDDNGDLDLTIKGKPERAPTGCVPWFVHLLRKPVPHILFGHWAALEGRTSVDNVTALDTGCVWGGALTALRLDDRHSFRMACH